MVYVAGNHEFYGQSLPALIDELRSAAVGSSVHMLEQGVTAHGLQHLGQVGMHTLALAGGQDDDTQRHGGRGSRIRSRIKRPS